MKYILKDLFREEKSKKTGVSDFAQSNDVSVYKCRDRGTKFVIVVRLAMCYNQTKRTRKKLKQLKQGKI